MTFNLLHGCDELVKLFLDIVDIILSCQEIETVDPESFDILSIFDENFLHSFQRLFPITIDHVNFGLFKQGWKEIFILNCYLTQGFQCQIILFLFFIHFGFTKHGFQMFGVMPFILILGKRLLKIGERFHLQFFFWCGQKDPAFQANGVLTASSVIDHFLDVLACSFELLNMPQE